MSTQDLETAFDLIEANGGGDFEGPKEDSLINKAEVVLGLTFPSSYRRFLATLGCGDIEGLEFYGLVRDDFEHSSVPDAIWLTINERKAGLPNNLVLIYAAGDGTYYALDTWQVDDSGECPVVSYDVDGEIEKIADDYGSFLLSELRTVLS
jgi:hypothetical protein